MVNEVYVGRIRSGITHGLLVVATLGLYFFVWHFLINRDLRRHRGHGTSPVGLLLLELFVPVLGWFIAVLITALAIRSVQRDADADKRTGVFIGPLWTLVPILGWAFACATLQAGANHAWDRLHRRLGVAASGPTMVECPQCTHRHELFLNPFAPNAVVCPSCGRTGEV
jgi:ribosomal protein L32